MVLINLGNIGNIGISGSDKLLFLKKILPESGAEKVLECAFGGPKGAFKQYQENLSVQYGILYLYSILFYL